MKIIRTVFFACAALALAGTAYAQNDFDFGDSTDSSATDGSSPASASAPATPVVSIGGAVSLDARAYLDQAGSDLEDFPTEVTPDAKLSFKYSTDATELDFKLDFSEDAIKDNPSDVIEEATARAYLGNFILEGGKMKVVWGKGDKLHVIDNFNANDYTDFIYPDYIDRRLAEPMVRGVLNGSSGMWRAEAIYAPMMTADRYDTDGVWTPAQVSSLTAGVEKMFKTVLGVIHSPSLSANQASALVAASSFDSDDLYPDTNTLKYSQYGLRFTGTAGAFDWGASYYYGHYKQVSVDQSKLTPYLTQYFTNYGSTGLESGFEFDRLQTYGLEGATALGPLNMRFEGGYNLTDDVKGDDPAVRNNSVAWVGGFDIDLPIHNVNFNVQETGTVLLQGDKIKDNGDDDVNADANDCFTNNKIVVDITDSFLHENLKLDLKALYGIERGDLVVMPKVTYTVKTDMDVSLGGMYVRCADEDSEFYAYEDNSFVQLGVSYQF